MDKIKDSDILEGAQLAIDSLKDFSDIEKIAILRSAAGTLESKVNASTFGLLIAKSLNT